MKILFIALPVLSPIPILRSFNFQFSGHSLLKAISYPQAPSSKNSANQHSDPKKEVTHIIGLPLVPFPPADSPSNPKYARSWHTAPFPTLTVVKKASRCAWLVRKNRIVFRVRITDAVNLPLVVRTLCEAGKMMSDKTGWVHASPRHHRKDYSFVLMMPSGMICFTLEYDFFCMIRFVG